MSAWKEQLAKKGIICSKRNENTLCFDSEQIIEIQEARLSTEPNYRGAATIVDTGEERRRLLEFIRQGEREYNGKQRDAGRTFAVVYSTSGAELKETQLMFSCIQYQDDCLE